MGKPSRCQHRERPAEYIGGREPTQGSEPSQYLEEEKATAIPLVAASESGTAQTQPSFEISNLRFEICDFKGGLGVVGRASVQSHRVINPAASRTTWKSRPQSVIAT